MPTALRGIQQTFDSVTLAPDYRNDDMRTIDRTHKYLPLAPLGAKLSERGDGCGGRGGGEGGDGSFNCTWLIAASDPAARRQANKNNVSSIPPESNTIRLSSCSHPPPPVCASGVVVFKLGPETLGVDLGLPFTGKVYVCYSLIATCGTLTNDGIIRGPGILPGAMSSRENWFQYLMRNIIII